MGIFIFLLALTLVIAIHEYGHYLACRVFSIPVAQFAVGMGKPILKHTDKRGTEWSLRPIPLGGFVLPEPGTLAATSPLKKAVVAFAGPLANILPFAVLAAAFGKLGIFMSVLGSLYLATFVSLFNVLTFNHFVAPVVAAANTNTATGPIGLAASTVHIVHEVGPLLTFGFLFAALSLGIGLLNLVPIPLFDGGRIVLSGVEAVIGSERTARVERYTNVIGVVLILSLVAIVTATDIWNLF